MPNIIERQLLSTLKAQHNELVRKYDHVLFLMNQSPTTVEADMNYAIIRLAELVARQFPEAEPMFSHTREQPSYHLPRPWEKDISPYWEVECPRLVASYDNLLLQPDVSLNLDYSGNAWLYLERQFSVDSVKARVTLEAQVPAEETCLLRSLDKIQEETTSPETRAYFAC